MDQTEETKETAGEQPGGTKDSVNMTMLLIAAQRDCYLNVYRAIGELNACFDESAGNGKRPKKTVDINRAAKCIEVAHNAFQLGWSINEQMQRLAFSAKQHKAEDGKKA